MPSDDADLGTATKQETVSQPPTPGSVDDLTLVRERDRKRVNTFLEDTDVEHKLGPVPGWKAAFGAEYRGYLVAVCVVGRPVARMVDADDELSITRFATRPDRPANTGSWLIARARDWARLEGYSRLSAHAGVAGNHGTVYEATGFECVDVTRADGAGWTSREDRDSWEDYERRKWVYEL